MFSTIFYLFKCLFLNCRFFILLLDRPENLSEHSSLIAVAFCDLTLPWKATNYLIIKMANFRERVKLREILTVMCSASRFSFVKRYVPPFILTFKNKLVFFILKVCLSFFFSLRPPDFGFQRNLLLSCEFGLAQASMLLLAYQPRF